jgi:zinc-binding in reverse transcriptase
MELYTNLSAICLNTQEDSYIWRWKNKGLFTTNSCYSWLDFGGVENNQYQLIWSASIPLKIKICLWLVRKNKILTKENLQKRGWRGQNECIFVMLMKQLIIYLYTVQLLLVFGHGLQGITTFHF